MCCVACYALIIILDIFGCQARKYAEICWLCVFLYWLILTMVNFGLGSMLKCFSCLTFRFGCP
jgi:hypothetical protein